MGNLGSRNPLFIHWIGIKSHDRKYYKQEGKNHHSRASEAKFLPSTHPKKTGCSSNITKEKFLTLKENPPTQRYFANVLNCSVSIVSKINNSYLNIKKSKNYNVHNLSLRHIYERRTRWRTLYEKHLYQEKSGKIS